MPNSTAGDRELATGYAKRKRGKRSEIRLAYLLWPQEKRGQLGTDHSFWAWGRRGRVGNFPKQIPAKKNLLLKEIYHSWRAMEKKLSKCFALSRFYCRPNKAMHSLKMRKKNLVPENRPAPPPYQKIMVHPLHERILQWLEPQYYIIFCVNNSFTVTIIWAGVNKSCFNCFCSTASCAEPVQILHHNCLWL